MASTLAIVAHHRKLSKRTARALRKALAARGMGDATWIDVPKGSAATKAAAKALAHGAETLIVCGGDGTVRAAAEALVHTSASLAVLPTGTANLFAGAFDLPSDPVDVVDLALGPSRRVVDTGSCNKQTFAVMAGVGFDAGMLDGADDDKERLGMLAYVRAAVHEARTREPFEVEVLVDGEEIFDGRATCLLVGNVPTLKANIPAFPDGSPTDGRLDVAVLTSTGMREWAGVMVNAVRRQPMSSGHVTMSAGTRIEVRLDGKHRYELDGGVKGRKKKLVFRCHPSSLRLCAPTGT